MTIALTGATGNLGRLVLEELLADGTPAQEIVAIVRTPEKLADMAARGVIVRQAAYGDVPALTQALQGVDRLLLISISGADASKAHASVIEAAETAGITHIAYTSILNANKSSNPLAPEHLATEILLEQSTIPATILRNAWYHEYYTQFFYPTLKASGEMLDSTQGALISGAARKDLATAAVQVLTSKTPQARIYELGGTPFTLKELTDIFNKETGTALQHRELSPEDYISALEKLGFDTASASMFTESAKATA